MPDINEQSLEISCGNCGVSGPISIGWLRSVDQIDCTRCGTTNEVDAVKVNRWVKKAQKKIEKKRAKAMNKSQETISWESVIYGTLLLFFSAVVIKKCILFLLA